MIREMKIFGILILLGLKMMDILILRGRDLKMMTHFHSAISFVAIQTSNNIAQLNWTTQTETNLLGYNLYRNIENSTNGSQKINPQIDLRRKQHQRKQLFLHG